MSIGAYSAPLDNFMCTVGLPDNFTIQHGHGLTFSLKDNAISGADYHTVEWLDDRNNSVFINFSDAPSNDYYINETTTYNYYQEFAQLFLINSAPYLNGTEIYNVTIKGYNATDSITCPTVDFVTFKGEQMGVFEIAVTTPNIIILVFFAVMSFIMATGIMGENASYLGMLGGIVVGGIIILSGISYPLGFLFMGAVFIVTYKNT